MQAAANSPILNNAILAVSAKHLSVTRGFDRFAPDRYQRQCLLDLIPIQASMESDVDDMLFAATVILRLFDEMTGKMQEFVADLAKAAQRETGNQTQRHIHLVRTC